MFIIKVRDMATMQTFYYTGKAGEPGTNSFWLSDRRGEAFVYAGEGEATRKCNSFQRQHPKDVWMVEHVNRDDAHAAGAAAMSEEMCG